MPVKWQNASIYVYSKNYNAFVGFLKKDFIQVPVKLQKCILLFVWQYQSEYKILISTYM